MRLILASVLTVFSLLSSSCATQSATGQNVDKAFQPLIWPETQVLAAIDVSRLKKSPLYVEHQDDLNQTFKRVGADRFGIDVQRDVEYLAFSSDGKRSLFFAKGNFKNVKKNELQQGDGKNAVAFLGDRVAIAGSKESISSARALEEKGAGEIPEELASRLHSLAKDDAVWLVSRGPLPLEDFPMRTDMRSNLGNFVTLINGLTVGIAADTGLRLTSRVSSKTPEGATRIHDAFRGLLGLARLSTKDSETDMLRVYDAFQIKRNENIVEVNATLQGADVNKLLQRAPRSY